MALNKLQNLKINSDVQSSRFVVDLKKETAGINESKEIKYQVKPNLEARLEEKIEKLAEVDYKGMLKAGSENAKKNFTALMVRSRSFWIPSFAGMTRKKPVRKNKKSAERPDTLSNQLALIVLMKLLYVILKKVFGAFYRICYAAGWAVVFILRLVYFLLLAVFSLIKNLVYLLSIKFQPAVDKIIKDLPQDYRAKQVVAAKMSVEILDYVKRRAVNPPNPPFEGGLNIMKPVLVFAGVLLAIVLPVKAFTYYKAIDSVKGEVLGESESAVNNLFSAGLSAKNLNFNQAGQDFESAGNDFLSAQNKLEEINGLIFAIASIAPDKNMQLAAAGKDILRAGQLSAEAGKNLSLAMDGLFNHQAEAADGMFAGLTVYGHKAVIDLNELSATLNRIDSDVIPAAYQNQFILLKQKAGELNRGLEEFIGLADGLSAFLGASSDKRYLLVFQNNSELRASGGFIGSFALIDFSKGEIKNIEVPGGGSYDTEAGFLKKIKSPEPLSLVRADWHFWDANWWPDWPTSAKKLAWFYENSDGSTVDGVIGFTPAVIENLLKIIGPVDLRDKYGLVIDADNFWLETQKLAEQKPDVTKEPKKIIGDLMNKIIEEMPKRLTGNNLAPMLKAMADSLDNKNILFYFTDNELEAKADDMGWSGRIKNTAGDYLSVINSNIAGGKSDRKIKQEIIHRAEIQPDGSIIDDLTVRRIHQAVKRELFSGVRNVDWLRVYVPLGAELLEADGFKPVDKIFFDKDPGGLADDPDVLAGEGQARTDEASGTKIYNELGKTVFANWSQLDPGETIEINIKYRLPFKLTDKKPAAEAAFYDKLISLADSALNPEQNNFYAYSLLAQKQPGMNSSTLKSELLMGGGYKSIWRYPADLAGGQNGWAIDENFNQDKIMGIIAEEK